MSHDNKGFTIIELMLSMTFVSALLIAIALTVMQLANIYNKGSTYRSVNQAGTEIASELKRGIAQAEPFSVVIDGSGNGTNYINKQWGGRLCMGQYSYIWNYGSAINSLNPNRNTYSNSTAEIRFVKVLDSGAMYCKSASTRIESSRAVELLGVGERNLVMHKFMISNSASAQDGATGQRLYAIEFVIGTGNQSALVNIGGVTTCRLPNDNASDPAYCAINQFNLVTRSGNSVS